MLFLLPGYCTSAQVKFTASISPKEIGRDEYAQLKLVVENAHEVQQIVPPNLNKFNIISGPNQESGMTMNNGVVKKYIALNFIIKPKRTGVFTIPPALAKADGGDYKSNSVTVKVTAKATGNSQGASAFTSPFGGMDPFAEPAPRLNYNDYILRKGENPVDKIKKNMFLRVEVDKQSCFVGEPLVATYKLYTRLKSESNLVKNPSFNGFSVLDLQPPNDMGGYSIEKFDGREYNVYNIRKVQLYPLLPGNLDLGNAEIENKIIFIKAEYANSQPGVMNDVLRDFANAAIPPDGLEEQKVILQNKPISVLVKPLPEENKPAGFKGAVGKFTIESRVLQNNFSTDDAGKMAIIISGAGNLQMINAPEISFPGDFDVFDSKATDDLYKGTVPVSGRKIFEYPFAVSKAGNYTLPEVSFSFFDTQDAAYKTVTSKPLEITVTRGTGKTKTIIAEDKTREPNFLVQFFSNRLRVVSLVAVLIIIGLIVWLKRDTKQEKKIMAESALPEAAVENPVEDILMAQENPLATAEACLHGENSTLFYTELNLGLKHYLSGKLSIPAEALNRKNINERLDAKGISNETSVQLQELMNEIEWHLYTPYVDDAKMKEMYERAHDLIQLLNTYHIR
ncbi:MAG: protein BatD [Chitinophagaceae bacterium]|nr:protein BatD [Chitinophagaceae bacterium]